MASTADVMVLLVQRGAAPLSALPKHFRRRGLVPQQRRGNGALPMTAQDAAALTIAARVRATGVSAQDRAVALCKLRPSRIVVGELEAEGGEAGRHLAAAPDLLQAVASLIIHAPRWQEVISELTANQHAKADPLREAQVRADAVDYALCRPVIQISEGGKEFGASIFLPPLPGLEFGALPTCDYSSDHNIRWPLLLDLHNLLKGPDGRIPSCTREAVL